MKKRKQPTPFGNIKGFILSDGVEWYSVQQMADIIGRSRECVRLRVINGTIEKIKWGGVDMYRLSSGVSILRG
jgi:hypothetical protein